MTHDVTVNMVYTNKVKQATSGNDTVVDGGMDSNTPEETQFDDDERSEIISIVFTELCDRLKT